MKGFYLMLTYCSLIDTYIVDDDNIYTYIVDDIFTPVSKKYTGEVL